MNGPYYAIGKLVRAARKQKGMTRRQLVRWVRERQTLEVTTRGAETMVRELEDLGMVMKEDVLLWIFQVVGIVQANVADLLAKARASSAVDFVDDMKRASKVIARDQRRPETEVLAGVTKVAGLNCYRPMV